MSRRTRQGTVWIAEDLEEDDDFMLSGLFSGYLDRGGGSVDEFAGLRVDQAIEWARAVSAVAAGGP